MAYGPELKQHRKFIQTYTGTVASMKWIEEVEKLESRRLLLRILNEPSNFLQHIRTSVYSRTLFKFSDHNKAILTDTAQQLYWRFLMAIP